MFSSDDIAAFRERGFIAGGRVYSDREADERFRGHIYHDGICQGVSKLMDSEVVRVWHDQIQYKPPKVGGRRTGIRIIPIGPSSSPQTWSPPG